MTPKYYPRLYLAGAYERKVELAGYAKMLSDVGFETVSSWLTRDEEGWDKERMAEIDLYDIDKATAVVHFTGGGKGGRLFEAGYATAKEKEVYLIGPSETVFDSLCSGSWAFFDDFYMHVCDDIEEERRADLYE